MTLLSSAVKSDGEDEYPDQIETDTCSRLRRGGIVAAYASCTSRVCPSFVGLITSGLLVVRVLENLFV